MKRVFTSSYAAQVKMFLVLLVVFLAVAIYFNFDLLVLARNAIQEEAGQRLGVEADLVRVELERDQMLRGLAATPGQAPYIPPTFLDRMARLHGMVGIDILRTDGTVLTSSQPERIGTADGWLLERDGRELRRLMAGATAIAPLARLTGSRYATLSAYRPVRDRRRVAVALIRVEREVPLLASVDLDLRTIAAMQAGGLAVIVILVLLFARWLLTPYRRLQRAAGDAMVPVTTGRPGVTDEADALVGAFQGVVDKLRAQEGELLALKAGVSGASATLPETRLFAGMTSAALVFDATGRLANLNGAAEQLLALNRSTATGRRFEELFTANTRLTELIGAALRTGEGRSREVVPMRTSQGRVAHLGVMMSPLRGGDGALPGTVEGVVCLLTDLTEIRSLREKVRLKENLAALGSMSAGMAHEFRNSLAAIQGFARLASRAKDPAATRDHVEAILREVGGIQKVVGDFLRYARPATPDMQEIDLAALVADLATDFRADERRRGMVLQVEGWFPRIVADETLLRPALQNLLLNAAEALEPLLPADGTAAGVARDAQPMIILRGSVDPADAGILRIDVEDNGPGIPAADLPHVFTPFFTTKERGTGLGLALVQKAAIVHDGQAEARSVQGQGTRITLLLPLRPGETVAADLVA